MRERLINMYIFRSQKVPFLYELPLLVLIIQGGPEKNRTECSPQYEWMQYVVSVYEVTSREKNYTNISDIGSVVCFIGCILYNFIDLDRSTFLNGY